MENIYFEAYMEYFNGNISDENLDYILMTESSLSKSKKMIEKIEEIKKAKPAEYAGKPEVKKFVDKYYDDLIKCTEFLEKDIKDMNRNEIKDTIISIITMIGGMGTFMGGSFISAKIGIGLSIAGMLSMIIIPVVLGIIRYVQRNRDTKLSDDLMKVRSALKRIDKKNLDKDTQNKVSDICTAIDDVDTDVVARIKTVKESVNEIKKIKLDIYEAFENGKITETEKCILLSEVSNI